MKGKRESTKVQIRKDGKRIAYITIPYACKELDWRDALMRIKALAKAYEESGQKLDLRTYFNIAHTVSSETEINWKKINRGLQRILKRSSKSFHLA